MSLLAPFFMLALPLLAVPIILHMWRKRRRKTVPWGAMQFLVNDDHRQRRFSNIDRWLVLVARCLTLLFLIAALARPLLHSEQYGSLENQTDDILVLDHSLSTGRIDGTGVPTIDSIRTQAKQWVLTRPRGTSIRILMAAGRPAWLMDSPVTSANSGELLTKLDELRPLAARSDLAAAIRFAATTELDRADELTQSKRRVWVLTDGQASDWNLNSARSRTAFCDELAQEADVAIHLGIASSSGDPLSNVGLTPLASDGWRKSPGERLSLTTQIVNYADGPSPVSTAVWTIDAKEISREQIPALSARESRTLEASVIVGNAGTAVVACELQVNDSLAGDDRSTAVVETLDRVPVLLVSDREPNPRRLGEADFFAAALGSGKTEGNRERQGNQELNHRGSPDSKNGDRQQLWRSVFDVTRTTATQLADHSLDQFDAVVMFDSMKMPSSQMQSLVDFVHQGGGLWMFLGDQTDIESFNRDWYAGGLGLAPVNLQSLKVIPRPVDEVLPGQSIQSDPDSRLHPPDRGHPTLQWLSDSSNTDLSEVLIQRFYCVHRPDPNSETRILLRTGGGSPIGLLSNFGKGRVILQTVPMHPSWTNWPLTGSFVVMVDSWLRHATEPRRCIVNLTPGSPFRLRIPIAQSTTATEIESPSGDKTIALTVPTNEAGELRFSQTFESGVYEVRWKKPKRSSNQSSSGSMVVRRNFAVSRPPEESELAPLPKAFSEQLDRIANVNVHDLVKDSSAWTKGVGGGADTKLDVSQIPKLPIWTPLLYALLAFLLVELLLSSYASIRRYGSRGVEKSDQSNPMPTRKDRPAQQRMSASKPNRSEVTVG